MKIIARAAARNYIKFDRKLIFKMAMPGVTSAEKLILPLFFNDKKDTSPLGMLLSSNSVLKHLMDPWKEEKVMEDFNE